MRNPDQTLSRREHEVATNYAKGLSHKAIADALVIAPATVRTHLATIYRKLGVTSKLELAKALAAPSAGDVHPQTTRPHLFERPVLAVLPFVSLAQEAQQQFFADGLSEDLITRLSYLREINVVSRTTSFVFRDAGKTATDISSQIGARYILEGSVRASGHRLRVIANLIDGETGLSLWTERFDRDLTDLFTVQDEITYAIVTALDVELSDGRVALDPGGTKNYDAWELQQKAALSFLSYTAEGVRTARVLTKQAIDKDPDFLDAHLLHAWTYWQSARNRFPPDAETGFGACRRLIDALLAGETITATLKHIEAATLVMERRHDEALKAAEAAIAIGPSKWFGYTPASLALTYSGAAEESLDVLRETIRTIPATPSDTVYYMGFLLPLVGETEQAVAYAEEYLRRVPTDLCAYLVLALAYAFDGQSGRARSVIGQFREKFPGYRMPDFIAREPFRNQEILGIYVSKLRAAGLP